jgi:GntR family transcriptional repressor for pyruvate dehydrogenase complex
MTSTPALRRRAEAGSDIIRRRRLSDEVVSRLETMIDDGRYPPGEQLPSERDLMQMFGVGRPAVREALFSLQKMGLVAIQAGDRARVTRPTPAIVVESLSGAARHMLAAPDGARNFQDARLFFEVGLARHAARHASEADLAELRRALEANRQTIGDIAQFERTDVAFHYVLAVIPRNPIFTAFHAAMAHWLMEQRHITLSRPGQNQIAYRAHAAITKAILARDPDRAERLMRAHLEQVAEVYWEAMGAKS